MKTTVPIKPNPALYLQPIIIDRSKQTLEKLKQKAQKMKKWCKISMLGEKSPLGWNESAHATGSWISICRYGGSPPRVTATLLQHTWTDACFVTILDFLVHPYGFCLFHVG